MAIAILRFNDAITTMTSKNKNYIGVWGMGMMSLDFQQQLKLGKLSTQVLRGATGHWQEAN